MTTVIVLQPRLSLVRLWPLVDLTVRLDHDPLFASGYCIQLWLVGHTFPLGVYALATFRLAAVRQLSFSSIVEQDQP